jgi:hypothetical protein
VFSKFSYQTKHRLQSLHHVTILITLHVSVTFDHQVCVNKNKYTIFMLNYIIKIDPFVSSIKLKVAYIRVEYTKTYLLCCKIIKIYTPCFISPSGTNSPTGHESVSAKRANNQVSFFCLVPWISYPFLQ